jgi:hypothetical protein
MLIAHAWRTAYYQRVKKLPDLAKELKHSAEPKRATAARDWKKQLSAWERFATKKPRR